MNDQDTRLPLLDEPTSAARDLEPTAGEPPTPETPTSEPASEPALPNRFAKAGRLGAQRIQKLIKEGQLYEDEHGLTPGRQRLKQLIQEGKLYEREHGLESTGPRKHRKRTRMSREEVLLRLLDTLIRVSKPTFRERLIDLVQVLDSEARG